MENTIDLAPAKGNHPAWNEAWWTDFLDKSDFFKKSFTIHDVLTEDEVNYFNKLTLNIINEIFVRQNTSYDFRLYIEGISKDKAYMKDHLFLFPPLASETPEEWAKRVFDKQKFGLIINSGEKFSNDLAEKLALYLDPLLKMAGIPLKGINITIFLGNYGFTPLGIHKDHPGENVMHLHLGPGDKTMYNWEMAEYEELTGNAQNNKNVAPLIPLATKYHFRKGDIYFMPWNKYHIGNTEDFSVGISVWYNNMPLNKFLTTLLRSFKIQHIKSEQDQDSRVIVPPYRQVSADEGFDQLLTALNIDQENLESSLDAILKNIYKDYVLALHSNQGWKTRPIPLDQELNQNDDLSNFYHLKGKLLKSVYPFTMSYRVINDTVLIFARGTKIEIRYHEELLRIIDRLNTGHEILTEDLLQGLNQFWPEEAGLYTLNLFYIKRAIIY